MLAVACVGRLQLLLLCTSLTARSLAMPALGGAPALELSGGVTDFSECVIKSFSSETADETDDKQWLSVS